MRHVVTGTHTGTRKKNSSQKVKKSMKTISFLVVLAMFCLAPLGAAFSRSHSLTRSISSLYFGSISSSMTFSFTRSLNNKSNNLMSRSFTGGIRVGGMRSIGHSNWRPLSYALTQLNHLSISNSLSRSCTRSVFSGSRGSGGSGGSGGSNTIRSNRSNSQNGTE